MSDLSTDLQSRVAEAFAQRAPLCIRGGGSKTFLGGACTARSLELSGHRGVLNYEPSELVVTARAGTPLAEIETLLAQHGQMLPCEPPHFSSPPPRGEGSGERAATLGGMVASGLSGPRRPWAGAVRDGVLGVKLINDKGESLTFGGQVMKNVAGYDVSRLMAGSLGTLGVLLEVSLKVLPRPENEITLAFELDADNAQQRLNAWGRAALPISATLHESNTLRLRLSGGEAALQSARATLGGEVVEFDWREVREQRLAFFHAQPMLWRFSVPPASRLELDVPLLTEWGGAQRWACAPLDAGMARRAAARAGGHATLFRGKAPFNVNVAPATRESPLALGERGRGRGNGHGDRAFMIRGGATAMPVRGESNLPFTPLAAPLLALHQRIKAAFDPHGIFNPGRMYPEL
jgi:glycolate oxidase FAD binding subunit